METLSMLEFRKHAPEIVKRLQAGQHMVLTYRGKPVARLEPLQSSIAEDDAIYSLAKQADESADDLTNRDIDETVYGG